MVRWSKVILFVLCFITVFQQPVRGAACDTVISDGYGGSWWNTGPSDEPALALDSEGGIHVVWADETATPLWGMDGEIMYVKYTPTAGWSNASVISDGYNGVWWNLGTSAHPAVAVDAFGALHVVWMDASMDRFGPDLEIMYANYSVAQGWSNASIISDDQTGWNDDSSGYPAIAAGMNGSLHVVWDDDTDGMWGTDEEIMYRRYSPSSGWSSVAVISDTLAQNPWIGWGNSFYPDIAVNAAGTIHVVWEDKTANAHWGTDGEIMYASCAAGGAWTPAIVISDGYNGSYWNTGVCEEPAIAAGPNGTLYVVWEDRSFSPYFYGACYAQYTPGIGWSNVTLLSERDHMVTLTDVSVGDDGVVQVVWADQYYSDPPQIGYRTYSNSKWSSIRYLSATYWGCVSPAIAVDTSGRTHIVYQTTLSDDSEIAYCRLAPSSGGVPAFPFAGAAFGVLLSVYAVGLWRRYMRKFS